MEFAGEGKEDPVKDNLYLGIVLAVVVIVTGVFQEGWKSEILIWNSNLKF